jgi:hexosaminidase
LRRKKNSGKGFLLMSDYFIIPVPTKVNLLADEFVLRADTSIFADENAWKSAELLAAQLNASTGFNLYPEKYDSGSDTDNSICLRTDRILQELGEAGYLLNVSPERIDITAGIRAGTFYGCQTLLQLMPPEMMSTQRVKGVTWRVPCIEIEDKPRFGWRGYMLDSSRYFQEKEYIKKIIDLLALYKFNRLHWHLIDDHGWRVEIKSWPRLTEVGAFRPNTKAKDNYNPREPSDNYGGYYTRDDIREIVAYAAERHITVVPEVEMPGHVLSAIMSYPELSCRGETPAEKGGVYVFKDVYCPGKEGTFKFLEDVLIEIMELFPSPWIHVGGDECPRDRWKECPDCQSRIKAEGLKDENELQSYFVRRIENFLHDNGRRLIGWDEILEGGLAPRATVQSWRDAEHSVTTINLGHDTILSTHLFCYLDYDYEGTPIEKAYSYEPVPSEIPEDKLHHILGIEGCQWLGMVSSRYMDETGEIMPLSRIEHHSFPRLIALSEVAWSPRDAKDWPGFKKRLKHHGRILDIIGVNYYRDPDIWPE